MKKRKKAVRLPYLVLVPFAASVCLVIWMIFSGALMSTDEAKVPCFPALQPVSFRLR